ncbi:MAG: hypothetical protein IKT40_04575 [Bacilli bacterium]|nr:hypothetical protein [Bacilli bacterium]
MNDLFHDDNKTKKELLDNIEIRKTDYNDINDIIEIMQNNFNIKTKEFVIQQLLFSNVFIKESIKVIDKRDNKIYGILLLSRFNIDKGSPIKMENLELANKLSDLTQLNGFAFVIDKRLRNTKIDKEILNFNKEYIDKFDFIWCAVDKSLKSQNYWKRLGFEEIININEANFYIKFNNANIYL